LLRILTVRRCKQPKNTAKVLQDKELVEKGRKNARRSLPAFFFADQMSSNKRRNKYAKHFYQVATGHENLRIVLDSIYCNQMLWAGDSANSLQY